MLLDGAEVSGPGADRGMVFQSYTLFPWLTIEENVRFGLREKGLPVAEQASIARHWIRKVGLDGFCVHSYVEGLWNLEVLRFQYLYVGLPGLDSVQYMQGDKWLGVALSALMKIPPDRVDWLGAEALRRLTEAPLSEQERFLLGECVQAYLPLGEEQRSQFENLLQSGTYVEVRAINQTMYDKGIEKGIEKGRQEERQEGSQEGRQEGQVELICSLIEDRFGPVTAAIRAGSVCVSPVARSR